jgi:hypothetical protein
MRETLFRGKPLSKTTLLKQDHGWVYGLPVPIRINTYETDRIEMVGFHNYDELDYYELQSEDDEVDPKTVGQYIGLKDADGKKIFEGDILESPVIHYSRKLTRRIIVTDIRECKFMSLYVNEYRVVGNVHDNPEMLELEYDD